MTGRLVRRIYLFLFLLCPQKACTTTRNQLQAQTYNNCGSTQYDPKIGPGEQSSWIACRMFNQGPLQNTHLYWSSFPGHYWSFTYDTRLNGKGSTPAPGTEIATYFGNNLNFDNVCTKKNSLYLFWTNHGVVYGEWIITIPIIPGCDPFHTAHRYSTHL